jgi:hypothetical protein
VLETKEFTIPSGGSNDLPYAAEETRQWRYKTEPLPVKVTTEWGVRNGTLEITDRSGAVTLLRLDARPQTTITAPAAAGATSITVADASGLAVGNILRLTDGADTELKTITGIAGTTLTVTRGVSTLPANHPNNALVVRQPSIFTVVDGAGIWPGSVLQVDSEQLGVTAVVGNTVTASRGFNATAVANHISGAPVTLQRALGYVMAPLVWLAGVPWAEATTAGALMGTKTILNEFLAYQQLAANMQALDPRTVRIASFALCGFANFGSLAIVLGGLGGMVPERRGDLARFGVRAIVAGSLATFLSGTIAGLVGG